MKRIAVRTAAFVTATELEPRTYGKSVVIGGIMDHLCDRLGAENVHLVIIGRPEVERPPVAYVRHVIPKPASFAQVRAVLRHVVVPPFGLDSDRLSLQESALRSNAVAASLRTLLDEIDPDLEIWDTVRVGQYARSVPPRNGLAHPDDPEAPSFNEVDISWVDWSVQNFTGIELWNALSELKTIVPTKLHGAFYAFFPSFVAHQPIPSTLAKWDELLSKGSRVVAIGGSDAHALHMSMGPISRVIFPYEFHFRTVNTHVFTTDALSGDANKDKKLIYDAMAAGHCYVGYDLPSSTRGFNFTAQGMDKTAIMGDELPVKGGVTLQARLPSEAEIRLLKDGKVIQTWKNKTSCTHITTEAGVYRVEVYRRYLGRLRGWIYSNAMYVR